MNEIWKPIEGHEAYEVSSLGRIRSIDRIDCNGARRKGRVLKPLHKAQPGAGTGSSYVTVSNEGKVKRLSISRVVYLTFVGPIEDGHVVRFKDGNFKNPSVDNLYSQPRQEYMRPFNYAHQTISTEQMRLILQRRAQKVPFRVISEETGISVGRLNHAVNGRTHNIQKCEILAES